MLGDAAAEREEATEATADETEAAAEVSDAATDEAEAAADVADVAADVAEAALGALRVTPAFRQRLWVRERSPASVISTGNNAIP